MARVLLVLPTATYRAPDFLDAARALGAEVVVASEAEQAMAMGDRAVTVDPCDPLASAQAIADVHRRKALDAVIGVDEQGVLVAAHAAALIGIPHNPPEAVSITRDKALLRRLLTDGGLRQPRFALVSGPHPSLEGDNRHPQVTAPEFEGPYVVKAASLSGSRGVIRAENALDVPSVVARVQAIAGDDAAVVVEEYVPGAEVAVEGLLRSGVLDVLAIFDKPDPLEGPYFEETIYVTPSRHDASEIEKTVQLACDSVGLVEGPIHAELRLPDVGPVLLEIAARSIGGLCSRTLRFGAGISLEEVILRHALGLDAGDLRRTKAASGVMMIPIPRSGVLHAVEGVENARGVAGVDGVEITIPIGQPVKALPEGDRYLGFIFASGGASDVVERSLRDAHSRLETDIR